jgi:hypothetical protein
MGRVVKILGGRERVVCISGRDGYSDTLSRVFDIMMTMIRLKMIFVSNVLEMVAGAVRKSKSDIVLSTLAVSLYTE